MGGYGRTGFGSGGMPPMMNTSIESSSRDKLAQLNSQKQRTQRMLDDKISTRDDFPGGLAMGSRKQSQTGLSRYDDVNDDYQAMGVRGQQQSGGGGYGCGQAPTPRYGAPSRPTRYEQGDSGAQYGEAQSRYGNKSAMYDGHPGSFEQQGYGRFDSQGESGSSNKLTNSAVRGQSSGYNDGGFGSSSDSNRDGYGRNERSGYEGNAGGHTQTNSGYGGNNFQGYGGNVDDFDRGQPSNHGYGGSQSGGYGVKAVDRGGYGGYSAGKYGGNSTEGYGGNSAAGYGGNSASGYGGKSADGYGGNSTGGYGGNSTGGYRGNSASGQTGKYGRGGNQSGAREINRNFQKRY